MANILLKNATKAYNGGKLVAISDLTFECKDKEFVAILGPSGAGKTSTLKMIAGIEDLTEGKLLIDDVDMTDIPSQLRNVSMVFEGYALYPHFTVRENLMFPLNAPSRTKALTKEEKTKCVEQWANTVGLQDLLDRKPSQLSGGQRQRVSLARALVRSPEPNVILMDEPIAHLDAKLRNSMRAELKRLHKDLGATIIYVTHDYVEAMGMADRIVVINNGVVMQQGTPGEIYTNPTNEFVALTVGEPPMNFLQGEVTSQDGATYFTYRDQRIMFSSNLNYSRTVDLGVRPSELLVSKQNLGQSAFFGTIKAVLPNGAKQIIDVNVSGKRILAKMPRDLNYRIGDRVYLSPNRDSLFLFDSKTKVRLSNWEGGVKYG